jgi:hypothetical protein
MDVIEPFSGEAWFDLIEASIRMFYILCLSTFSG